MDIVIISVDRDDIEGSNKYPDSSKVPSPLQVCVGTYPLVLVYFSFKLINLFI